MIHFSYRGKKQHNYFEGWYTRLIDKDHNINLAIILAVTHYLEDPHAFIQLYNGVTLQNHYFKFDITDFSYHQDKIKIGNNILSKEGIILDTELVKLDVQFENAIFLQSHFGFHSAMSYLYLAPLQCFQEINVLDGTYTGTITIDEQQKISGSYYIEKTYGTQFPNKWIWLQANQFDQNVCAPYPGEVYHSIKRTYLGFSLWCISTKRISICFL